MMDAALSDADIMRALKGRTNIVSYGQLASVKRIEDIMVSGNVVILYEDKHGSGHWTCCFIRTGTQRGKPELHHFDSYGMILDDEMKYISFRFRSVSGQNKTHLTRLFLGWLDRHPSGQARYNDYRLQKMKNGINTCGRWVIARLLDKSLNEDEFADELPDDRAVLKYTRQILGK